MTIMNVSISPSCAVVVSDTLVSHLVTEEAFAHHDKVIPLPRFGAFMSCRGHTLPIFAVWVRLLEGEPIGSIEDLAEFAGPIINRVTAENLNPDGPTTLSVSYICGWSAARGRCVGYEFGVETDFLPKEMPDGLQLNPSIPGDTPADWMAIATEQQRVDLLRPDEDQGNIGGWLMLHTIIAPDGLPEFRIKNLGKMPGFDRLDAAAKAERAKILASGSSADAASA